MTEESAYHRHLGDIEEVIRRICRRYRLSGADAEDFHQEAHLKLLEARTLDKFQGRCAIRTFLSVVLERIYLDCRIKAWGKWRPSVEARRRGPVAVKLEQLIVRDGLTFEEAFETLKTNYIVPESRQQLAALAALLPLRVVRRAKGEEALVSVPDGAPAADAALMRDELQARAARVRDALARALGQLDAADRMILKLRFENGLQVVQIAALVDEDHKRLFRRIDKLKEQLRQRLEGEGIDAEGLFDDDEPWDE